MFFRAIKLLPFTTIFLFSIPAIGSSASFNCSDSSLKTDERTICKHIDLNDQDVRISTMYNMLEILLPPEQKSRMVIQQREWIQRRERCGASVDCLRNEYQGRLNDLNSYVEDVSID